MPIRAALKAVAILAGVGVAGLASVAPASRAAQPPKPAISEEASAAVAQMGKSLQADQFSFQARTLRVYADTNGQPLHIAHAMKVTLRRPDRLRVDLTGDDGSTKLIYDGKTAVLWGVDSNKYASTAVPGTIQGMLETMMGRLHVDFPLADFLTDAPDKSILFGVSSGREVNTVTIDGVPCRHLLLSQPPGIELELWVEKNDRSLPRRLIATYRDLPGQPSFVAEMSDWDFSAHPSDADFAFQPPDGAVQIELKPPTTAKAPATAKTPAKQKGGG
jgi:hypothetical protein